MKNFKEFHIKTNPFLPEIISGLLWELNISGLIEENDFIKIFSERNNLSKKEIKNLLNKLKKENLVEEFSIKEFKLVNNNWNEEWEKNLKIIKVTDRIAIKPSSKNYTPNANEIVLT